ncbi:MAG: Rpn family recombination-promoting nuclease/putative transposase [Lachnospiraceae bacterium]|nr:Rpn family recombination-promoting nuclease/putative transposase [Lachnospiraceae bacterium]MCI8780903.1 Rpn family recombination-promoting nuclease/putative transposase [Lachnospiraceae bacterium]
MAEFLMKPKIDFAFKEIMTDEKARIGFLSAMLKLNPEDIKETTLLNTSLRKTYEDDKLGILDVRVLMNDDTEIDIEVQLSELSVWAERSLFYLAKMYTEQINPGDSYNKFKKCVSISILDFKLFDDTKNFYSCFHIAEDNRHSLYTDKMEFHVLELPNPPEQPKNNSDNISLWAKFINAERKEEFDMVADKNPYIESAYQTLQVISQNKEKRLEYEAREKAIRDHNQFLFEARQKGRAEGREMGEERINVLNTILINSNRIDDLKRAAADKTFQIQLMNELLPDDLL